LSVLAAAMVHPLFRLAAARPQLLAEHVAAYTELLAEELTSTAGLVKQRLVLQAVALAGAAVGAVLAGVALMLWAALPADSLRMPWLLVLTPALPWAIALWAVARSGAVASGDLLPSFRRQLADDAAMLRGAAGSEA
jgi:hypothetical protein